MSSQVDLFNWWAATITSSSIFLILLSIYIYTGTKTRRKESGQTTSNIVSIVKDFVFVWILLVLLIFYIVSIQVESIVIFAAGNILVEILLIAYLLKNRTEKTRGNAALPSVT